MIKCILTIVFICVGLNSVAEEVAVGDSVVILLIDNFISMDDVYKEACFAEKVMEQKKLGLPTRKSGCSIAEKDRLEAISLLFAAMESNKSAHTPVNIGVLNKEITKSLLSAYDNAYELMLTKCFSDKGDIKQASECTNAMEALRISAETLGASFGGRWLRLDQQFVDVITPG